MNSYGQGILYESIIKVDFIKKQYTIDAIGQLFTLNE